MKERLANVLRKKTYRKFVIDIWKTLHCHLYYSSIRWYKSKSVLLTHIDKGIDEHIKN